MCHPDSALPVSTLNNSQDNHGYFTLKMSRVDILFNQAEPPPYDFLTLTTLFQKRNSYNNELFAELAKEEEMAKRHSVLVLENWCHRPARG